MTRRMIIMLGLATLIFGGIFGWKAFTGAQIAKAMQAMEMPPATVSTARASNDTWRPTIPAVGSLRAMQGVDVTPQIAGMITELHFDSGDTVKAGELLLRQYTADEQARLSGLIADTRLAELNYARSKDLIAKKLISEFDYDKNETDLQRARAAEQNLRLTIEQKSIRAPFSGRLGIRQVDLGQYIEPGDSIVRLEALEKILIDFPVPQRHIGQLQKGQLLSVTVDAWPGQSFVGIIRAVEPQIVKETRNIRVQGVIENPAGKLAPGMFGKIDIELEQEDTVTTVPQSTITYSPYGDSVYIVEETQSANGEPVLTVRNQFVVTGPTRGDQVSILSGLEPGMTVVSAGQQKLRNGAKVVVDNSVAVSNQAAPRPANN